jgi:DNA-binding CsgD family transcriptional regulator
LSILPKLCGKSAAFAVARHLISVSLKTVDGGGHEQGVELAAYVWYSMEIIKSSERGSGEMTHPILLENEKNRLTIRLPLLICFAMFTAWQIGVFSYSGNALSVEGRLPFDVDAGNFKPLISLGYILSIAYMLAFPKRIVWAERVMAGTALLCALALYLPIEHETRTLIFLVQLLCCCVMIGFETALIIGIFSEQTAVFHLLVAYGLIFALAGFMQNNFFEIPYWAFQHFNVAAIALQSVFYWKLPTKIWGRYVNKKSASGLVCPKRFFAGLLALCFLGNILISFGLSVAESVPHGVFAFDISFATFAIAGYALLRRFGIAPRRCVSVAVIASVRGFVLAVVALYLPAVALPACVLLGPGSVSCILIPYYGVVMTKRYPTRWVAPAIIAISFVASVLLLSLLIEALRGDEALLYTMYLAVAVTVAVLYLFLEPYQLYSFHGKSTIAKLLETAEQGERAQSGNGAQSSSGMQNDSGAQSGNGIQSIGGVQNGDGTQSGNGAAAADDAKIPDSASTVSAQAQTQADTYISESAHSIASHSIERLTRKELEIMDMMLQGLTAKEIAKQMMNSVRTITTHQSHIYGKLQIHRVQELFAIERALREDSGAASGED